MAAISLEHVTKEFAAGVVAVDDVNLTIAKGEFMVLVGPSGCGKSTLLRMIAGLEEITDGTISIGDRDVTYLPPPDRDIGMGFEHGALYPDMRGRRIVQVDVPQRLSQAPIDLFVAAFIGSPSMNLVEARIDGETVAFGQFDVPLTTDRRPPPGVTDVVLGIRPEAFDDAAFTHKSLPRLNVSVEVLEELGSDSHVVFPVAAPRVTIESRDQANDDAT